MEETREKIVISILISLTILLWFINQWLTNQLYYETPQYVNIRQWTHYLLIINNGLRMQLLSDESYTKIASGAAREGFVPGTFITP